MKVTGSDCLSPDSCAVSASLVARDAHPFLGGDSAALLGQPSPCRTNTSLRLSIPWLFSPWGQEPKAALKAKAEIRKPPRCLPAPAVCQDEAAAARSPSAPHGAASPGGHC